MEDAGVTAGIVAALVALAEAIKFMITRLVPQKPNLPKQELQQRDATRDGVKKLVDVVDKLWDLHNQKDSDGIPVWYVPRSWLTSQHEIAARLQQVADVQRRTLELLERMERDRELSSKIARVRAETYGED